MILTRTRRTWLIAAAVAAIVTAANASQGAYFSQSWGWVALAFLVPTTVLLILDRVTVPGRLRIAFAGLMTAFAVWIALSSIWSISTAASIREVERMLVYVAVAVAIALVLRRGDGPGVLAGIGIGIVLICAYALATRLFPDRLDTYDDPSNYYRLAAPLGYWNSLGLLASMGALVAVGLAAHARRGFVALAAAATVPVTASTLYFTFSRGAWVALVIGFATAVAVDPRRLRLLWGSLVVALPSAACIAYASGLDALTTEDSPVAEATRQGHRFAAVVFLAVASSALAAWCARTVSRRVRISHAARRRVDLVLASSVAVLAAAALAFIGGPTAAVESIKERFTINPAAVAGVGRTDLDLNDRIFSVSGNGRSWQLRVAWDAARDRPLVGNGSGTFEYLWYERRSHPLVVRDGHSLYMETLAELGVVGLLILTGALLVPIGAAIPARRQRFVATGLGAFVAWCAAASLDWHWEMVGVTMTALLAGSIGLLATERSALGELRPRARGALIGGTVVVSVLAVWSLVGNQALFASREALGRKEWNEAREDGRRAEALLFWSAEPELAVGDAAAGLGDRDGALRAYRAAVRTDPRSWVAWLDVAQVARGAERAAAYRRVHALNPVDKELPGE